MVGGARGARQVVVGAPWYPYGVYSEAVERLLRDPPGVVARRSRGGPGRPRALPLVARTGDRDRGAHPADARAHDDRPAQRRTAHGAARARRRAGEPLARRRQRDGASPASGLAAQPARRPAGHRAAPRAAGGRVAAVELGPDERTTRWPEIERRIPQMRTYDAAHRA